jgi:Uma2 family endonuclease
MDGISDVMGRLQKLRADIILLEPVIQEELIRMDNQTLWHNVCHAVIGNTLETIPEGAHLFQCAWNNRQIFNDRNEDAEYMREHNRHQYLIANDLAILERSREKQPEIMVNIAELARFSMRCPYAGLERCPLRNFQFAADTKAKKESMP